MKKNTEKSLNHSDLPTLQDLTEEERYQLLAIIEDHRDVLPTEPRDLPKRVFDTIVEVAARGMKEAAMIKVLNVTYRQWYAMKEHRDVQMALRLGQMRDREDVVRVLRRKALEGNLTAIIFYLKAIHGFRDQGPGEGEAAVQVNITLPAALPVTQYHVSPEKDFHTVDSSNHSDSSLRVTRA